MTKGLTFSINITFLMFMSFLFGKVYPTESLMMRPGDTSYLAGILTSSFIHDNWMHLIYNSATLSVLYFFLIKEKQLEKPVMESVLLVVATNILVFLIGNPNYYYLGSSNLVYALAGFSIGSILFGRIYMMIVPLLLLGSILIGGLEIASDKVSYASHYLGMAIGFGYYCLRYFTKEKLQFGE